MEENHEIQSIRRRLEALESALRRLDAIEIILKDIQSNVDKKDVEYKSLRDLIFTFQISITKLNEYTDKIRSMELDVRSIRETDLRTIREKMIVYENNFRSFDDLRKLVSALILAVIPATLSGCIEILKFCIAHKIF